MFSQDGQAVLGNRVLFGVAGGDPVGSPGSFADAINEFVRTCERAGWRMAVLGQVESLSRFNAEFRPGYLARGIAFSSLPPSRPSPRR
ncbi:hypothetical protein AOZ06_21530 [Kibdelosporangium phytohabitans]|uniref:DUF2156 domain-containing protein n=1 Tax=Kibdelosporangium phytohabitans TaxID=860235 RepID=A0A0N9HQ01_9PSEU|nr:hypothetical protein AOZ06_21530 [Kibdelosporangium phytohabitans]